MKTKTLWLIWLYLFALCCVLGFIPDPTGFVKALLLILGLCFFIPGALLLIRGERSSIRWVKLISIFSLVLTLISLVLNITSVMMTPFWGQVFHIIMGIVSTPMLCCQSWIVSLFGWALLMSGSFFAKNSG